MIMNKKCKWLPLKIMMGIQYSANFLKNLMTTSRYF